MGVFRDTRSRLEETRSKVERSEILAQGKKIGVEVETLGGLVAEKVAKAGEKLIERIPQASLPVWLSVA